MENKSKKYKPTGKKKMKGFIYNAATGKNYNKADMKTYDTARNLVVNGIAYELVYQSEAFGRPVPRFVPVHPANGIPVYSYDLEERLNAFIYLRSINTDFLVDVFYPDAIYSYVGHGGGELELQSVTPHIFGQVPVAVYMSDRTPKPIFKPVKKLIDAVDKINSSDMNEIEKFALAIRVLYGGDITLDDIKKTDDGKTLVLDAGQKLEYLTRNVDITFHGNVRDFLISMIHKLSGIPDFSDPNFSAISGTALEYKLMDFENVCATYDSSMRQGVLTRAELMEAVLDYDKTGTNYTWIGDTLSRSISPLWVDFPRNKPRDDKYKLDCASIMKTIGISMQTIVEYLPMIDDPQKELDRIKQEQEEAYSLGAPEQPLGGVAANTAVPEISTDNGAQA